MYLHNSLLSEKVCSWQEYGRASGKATLVPSLDRSELVGQKPFYGKPNPVAHGYDEPILSITADSAM